jgi:hypothetical protein
VTFILMFVVEAPILIYHAVIKKKGYIGAIGVTLRERTHGIVLVESQEYPEDPESDHSE